jgi:starch synthase
MERHDQIKIAFLTPEYPHPRTPGLCGGIGTSIMNLANEMRKAGATVSIIVYGQDKDEAFEENGLAIYRVQSIEEGKLKRYYTQKKLERLINSLVRHKKVNVLEAPDWRGATSFISAKCPVVVKLHGSDTYFGHFDQRPVKWRIRFSEKRALQKADAVVSVSRFAADVTSELFSLRKKITIIPNGIDVKKFEVSPSNNERNILYFGTLVRKKGSLELPYIFNKVIERNPNARLTLVGLDSNDPATGNASVWNMIQQSLSAKALPNVHYAGSVPYTEIKSFIADAAVCVFPSFAEALPVSWIEAMAMAKAVVASDIGWAKELIVDGKEGFLVQPTHHQQFADKIMQLLDDQNLCQEFGISARKKVENQFSIEAVALQNLSFYYNLIKH